MISVSRSASTPDERVFELLLAAKASAIKGEPIPIVILTCDTAQVEASVKAAGGELGEVVPVEELMFHPERVTTDKAIIIVDYFAYKSCPVKDVLEELSPDGLNPKPSLVVVPERSSWEGFKITSFALPFFFIPLNDNAHRFSETADLVAMQRRFECLETSLARSLESVETDALETKTISSCVSRLNRTRASSSLRSHSVVDGNVEEFQRRLRNLAVGLAISGCSQTTATEILENVALSSVAPDRLRAMLDILSTESDPSSSKSTLTAYLRCDSSARVVYELEKLRLAEHDNSGRWWPCPEQRDVFGLVERASSRINRRGRPVS